MSTLLDFVFRVSKILPPPAASTAFLKQALAVVKPKAGQEGNVGQVFECVSPTQVAVRTDNQDVAQLFNAGMSKVYVLLADDLDLAAYLLPQKNKAFTLLISSDFDDSDMDSSVVTPEVKASVKIQDITWTAKPVGVLGNAITITYVDSLSDGSATASATGNAISVQIEAGVTTAQTIANAVLADSASNALVGSAVDVGDESDPQTAVGSTSLTGGVDEVTGPADFGSFEGVIAVSSDSQPFLRQQAAIEDRCALMRDDANGAKNMFFAFGTLLSNFSDWKNQQYITMPYSDSITELGEAESLFDDRISFVLSDPQFGNRLAFLVAGGKAITAPYILKNLCLDMQSRTLQWIAANQPDFTIANASLLETRLNEDVLQKMYIARRWLQSGTVTISLIEDNFVASGDIAVPTPKALWRVFTQLRQAD